MGSWRRYDEVAFARLKRALVDLRYAVRDLWSGMADYQDIQQRTPAGPSASTAAGGQKGTNEISKSMGNGTMELFLRVFANCENLHQGQEMLARLTTSLHDFSPSVSSSPKPYWKIPELFVITFSLSPPTQDAFQDIMNLCDVGWVKTESEFDRSSVWNRTSGQQFLIPEVSWAEIALIE